jgi:hypothetical protein
MPIAWIPGSPFAARRSAMHLNSHEYRNSAVSFLDSWLLAARRGLGTYATLGTWVQSSIAWIQVFLLLFVAALQN